jgi:sugar/nucleoside kinase (ribokinase family)
MGDPTLQSRALPAPLPEPLTESAFRAANLCVVGNLNRDLKTSPLRVREQLFEDGETSAEALVETIGGGGANSACAAAALGARVAFLGKIGADGLGDRLERALRSHGVAPRLARDPGVATGSSIALAFDHGRRHFISCLPNNEALRFEDLELSVLAHFDHLYRADLWFSRSMLFGGNQRLFQAARALGRAISIDLNWDPRWSVADAEEIRARKAAVRELLPLVDLAHGNARELREFTGAPDLDQALARLADWGIRAVVAHLGAAGAGYYREGKLLVEPPVPAARHLNTTGTGDVLSVCLMLLHGRAEPRAALRLANRVVSEFIEGRRHFLPSLP